MEINGMGIIKGIPVILYEKTETGEDAFHRMQYEETPVTVENVLVAPASGDEITDTLNLTGKHAVYTLGIPKGDTHAWEDRKVEFFGSMWRTTGFSTEGIEDMIPLRWNRKVTVERYG